MNALDLASRLGHERVLIVQERRVGLRAVIAIHDSTFGPAAGGTRMRRYPSFDDAVVDALLLSRAMTMKATFARMPYGGAKAVIDGDPATEKTEALLEAYAAAVEKLGGDFLTGCDMGIDFDDLAILARRTRFVAHAPAGATIDASDLTAIGVEASIATILERLDVPLSGATVAIQGVGQVGSRLARRLAAAGARLLVADVDAARASALARETDAAATPASEILSVRCDILAPCAAGGAITTETVAELRCRAICGAANNPLSDDAVADRIAARGVLYAPDFVVNAGGLLSLLFETGVVDEQGITERVQEIGADLAQLLDEAGRGGETPLAAAHRIVEERLATGRREAESRATAAPR